MKNRNNEDDQKEDEKYPESRVELLGICDINDRDFKTAVLKILSET